MGRRILAAIVVVLGLAAPAGAQVIYGPLRPMANTPVHTDADGNLGITGDVVCTSGCSGGTTDTDDGTVAGGQSTGIAINLSHLWNGVAWVRMPGDATNGLKVQLPEVTGTEFDVTAHTKSLQIGGTASGTGGEWHAAYVTSTQPGASANGLVVRDPSALSVNGGGLNTVGYGINAYSRSDSVVHSIESRDSTPLGTEYALLVRNIPSGTQPISAAALPLPTGAATDALQTTGNTSLASIKTNTDPLVASGGGGYVRQDSTATIAKETGGNLATIATNTASSAALNAGTLAATTVAAAIGAGAIVQVLVQNDPDNAVDVLCGSAASQVIQLKPGDGVTLWVTNLNIVQCKTVSSTGTVNYLAR